MNIKKFCRPNCFTTDPTDENRENPYENEQDWRSNEHSRVVFWDVSDTASKDVVLQKITVEIWIKFQSFLSGQ